MKKEEIERELINLAKLRWDCLRENPEYKKDFEEFIRKNPEQKDNPLLFENFYKPEEKSFRECQDRVEIYLSIVYHEKWSEYVYPILEKSFKVKWGVYPPVDTKVQYPNPFSLESLLYKPVTVLGNYSAELYEVTEDLSDAGYVGIRNLINEYLAKQFDGLAETSMRESKIVTIPNIIDVAVPIDTGKIILDIDLTQDVKYIKHKIGQIISEERERLIDNKTIENKREHIEVMVRQIKTYRYIREGRSFLEVAEETHPNKFKKSHKGAREAVRDDFLVAFKLVRRREYIPFEDLKKIKKNIPLLQKCDTCKTDNPEKYIKCIDIKWDKDTQDYGWKPLCPKVYRYLKKDHRRLRETTLSVKSLEYLGDKDF